jgi:hypothetical protein
MLFCVCNNAHTDRDLKSQASIELQSIIVIINLDKGSYPSSSVGPRFDKFFIIF